MTPIDSLQLEITPTNFESDESGSPSQISTGDAPPQMTSEDDDAVISILSNTFFVAGGFFFVMATAWDYAMYSNAADPDNLDLHSVLSALGYVIYQGLWIMGPLVYFLNSIIDVKWALIVKARDAARTNYLEKLASETPVAPDESGKGGRIKAALRRPKNMLRRMKRNMGSRRTLGAASTFGLGALLGLVASIMNLGATDTSLGQEESDNLYAWAAKLSSGSTHVYFISAIVALWRPPSAFLALCQPSSGGGTDNVAGVPWYSSPRTLFSYGDVLFGTAALIDVCLADASIDDGFLSLPIASSVLWTVDALLYLRGDYVTFYLLKDIENDTSDNDTPVIVEEMV